MSLYLDAAATDAARPEVLEAMWPYLTREFGNPSSRHHRGLSAARALTEARERVASIFGVRAGDIVFTSGGTEGNNLALRGITLGAADPAARVIRAETEHSSVLASAAALRRLHGVREAAVAVDSAGLITPEALAEALEPGATLVSIAYANNEFGSVQDIAALSALARESGARMHTDAVQAAGWLPLNMRELGVDSATVSGHKVGTPKGIGALYIRGRVPLEPLHYGGGQERGSRSGTQNVAGAVGLARALELAEAERVEASARLAVLREELISRILAEVPGSVLTGHRTRRLPAHASFLFEGTAGEAVLLELERSSILCSSGSACAAGSTEPSPALLALGVDPGLAQTAVRLSLPRSFGVADSERTVAAVRHAVETLRGAFPGRAARPAAGEGE